MTDDELDRRTVLRAAGGVALLGALAGCGGNGGGDGDGDGGDDGEDTTTGDDGGMDGDASLRVAHLSPDAPNVDVTVDGNEVLSDVPFRTVSDYLGVAAGEHDITIAAADDAETVVFDQTVTLEARGYTAAAIGELADDTDHPFEVALLEDTTSPPADGEARVRLLHASPDAPDVDVTVASNDTTLFDDVAFGETPSGTVQANDYTLEVRVATDADDGDIVNTYDVQLEGGTGYTAIALGYVTADDEPTDESFDLQVAVDTAIMG